MNENILLEAALRYAGKEWCVFPIHEGSGDTCTCGKDCGSVGKHPRISGWPTKATTDPEQIRRWWSGWPTANIGIACGPSKLVVSDIDAHNGGLETLASLKVDTSSALVSNTGSGSGSCHLIYKAEERSPLRNMTGVPGKGMDVRGVGGYIIVPPSVHSTGGRYKWNGQIGQLSRMPPRLLGLLRKGNNNGDRREREAAASAGGIEKGKRGSYLAQRAWNLREAGMPQREVLGAMVGINEEMCSPSIKSLRLESIVEGLFARRGEIDVLLTVAPDHEGNAQCVKILYGDDYLHCFEGGWLHWNGTCWERDIKSLKRNVVTTLERRRAEASVNAEYYGRILRGAKTSRANIDGTINMLESILPVDWSDFNKDEHLLNCSNGVVNLRTGGLTEHDRTQRFTYALNTEYHPDADQTMWLDFLGEIVNCEYREETVRFLQLAVGYSVTGSTKEEVLFYVQGPTRSGKGVFIETIKAVLGELAWEVSFSTFSGKRQAGDQGFDLAPLKACRFVAASESSRTQWLNEPFLKKITGRNSVQAAFKYSTPFNYVPVYKVWLTSNYPPMTDPGDDAAWGRIWAMKFPVSHLDAEDKDLKRRMLTCLEGVLAWMVEGAREWYKLGSKGLSKPTFIREAVLEARGELDTVLRWSQERLEEGEGFVINTDYYSSYVLWCSREGIKPRGLRTVTSDLKRLGYKVGRNRARTCRGLIGCVLKQKFLNIRDAVM